MSATLCAVQVRHGANHALSDVDLRIGAGERIAIIGPSGAGKTTLLRLLATAQQPSAGAVTVLDTDPWSIEGNRRQRLRSRIGLIHQAPPLPPRQRVVTAIGAGRLGRWSLARSLLNLIHPLDIDTIEATLARFDLAEKLFARCDQLSGGELQRVGIARVLYQQPELLLADEPVSAMDPVLADHTLALLNAEVQMRGVTLVASLHAVDLALHHFPRIIGLRDGRIQFDKVATDLRGEELDALYANETLHSETPRIMATPVRIPLCG